MQQRERRATTRARLIEAARVVFATRGFDVARVDDIVAAADLSKGAFYFHFSAKEDVLVELARGWCAGRTAALKRAHDEEDPPARLRSMLALLFEIEMDRAGSGIILEFWSQARKVPELRQRLHRASRHWTQLLASALGDAFIENDLANAPEAAAAILASANGLALDVAAGFDRATVTPARGAALAWSVLAALDSGAARLSADGIAAINASTPEDLRTEVRAAHA